MRSRILRISRKRYKNDYGRSFEIVYRIAVLILSRKIISKFRTLLYQITFQYKFFFIKLAFLIKINKMNGKPSSFGNMLTSSVFAHF